jgi:hypothetical protein
LVMALTEPEVTFKEHAQNGPGMEHAAQRTDESCSCLATCSRALCAKEEHIVRVSHPDLDRLSGRLEYLLTTGGDPRLDVDPIRMLNRYGCRAWPQPDVLTFASSTATSISPRGFAAAAAMHQQLLQCDDEVELENACNRQAERLRDQIRTALELEGSGVEIVFSPSGTDSEVHALYVAQQVLAGPIVNVIAAADETGKGVPEAAAGCHFSSRTAQGAAVVKGERIPGFGADTTSIAIPLRKDGTVLSNAAIDQEVLAAVAQSMAAGKRVVLHVMDNSKLGWRCPSLECVRGIEERWGNSVQVIVDACQFRLSRPRLKYYLSQGFLVLITGSKFLAGPPFSGALLVPAAVSGVMERANAIPEGLRLYANRSDWPVRWQGVRSGLWTRSNAGQLLRWAAAAEELRAYFAVPASYRLQALGLFSSTVQRLIAERPNLQAVPAYEGSGWDAIDDEEMAGPTVFPFLVRRHGALLSFDACQRMYRALQCDVSHLLPDSASAGQRELAGTPCHLGQPVEVRFPSEGAVGALRISASARVVLETWCATSETAPLGKLKQQFEQVRRMLDKLDLLVENFDALRE